MLDVVHHGFDHDDGVVDDDADGEHQAEHRQRVHREAEHREKNERADQRHGHGEKRNDRRPQVLQKDENHQGDQDDRLDEGMDDAFDGGIDRRRGVIDDLVVHVRRKQPLRLAQGFVDRFGGLELVCARQQIDGHRAGWLAVEPAEGVVVLRAELGAPDVLDPDLRAGGGLADDDVLKFVGIDQAPGGAHRVGEFLVFR